MTNPNQAADERARFEKWMIEEAKIIIGSNDPYPQGLERDYWSVWQAALSQPPTEQKCERCDNLRSHLDIAHKKWIRDEEEIAELRKERDDIRAEYLEVAGKYHEINISQRHKIVELEQRLARQVPDNIAAQEIKYSTLRIMNDHRIQNGDSIYREISSLVQKLATTTQPAADGENQ